MAVVIGSNLRKEIAGSLLFEGVSFSVERGDRLSLSGPNGAGKTTLLRMLAGETEVHGGELVFAKGTRIALHDQRPPLQHGLTLREYALSGARDLVETEEELRSLEQSMAGGEHGPATLRRYSEAQARTAGAKQLYCLSTQAVNYFVQKGGFRLGTPDDLPASRRERYDRSGRRSVVMLKHFGT